MTTTTMTPTPDTPPETRFQADLLPTLLAPAQLFLVSPLGIFLGNREEMGVGIGSLLPYLLGATLVAWAMLFGVSRLVPATLRPAYRVLVTAIGIVLWVLGSLWVGDYGVFDGRPIDFTAQAGRVPLELVAWIAIPLLAIAFHQRLAGICGVLTGALLATQLAGLVFGGLFSGDDQTQTDLAPPDAIFQLSKQQNALVLVLDAFQSEALVEQLRGSNGEALRRALPGFTFFPEHTSAFPNTRPSIPAMLSGQRYANDRPITDFYNDTLKNRSLITAFDRAGWEVDMVSMVGRMLRGPLTHRYRLPRPLASAEDIRFHEAARLVDVSLFRHAPHALKSWVYNDQAWRVMGLSTLSRNVHHSSNGKDFLERFTTSLTVSREAPVAKIIHVGLPHLPAVLDADCVWIGVGKDNRDRYVNQTRCAMRLVARLVERLQSLGVYDDMQIVIAADHGTFYAPPSFEGHAPQPASMTWLVGRAMPLLMVKPVGATGPLVTSHAPTAISDVAATVGDALDLDFPFPGTSVFDLPGEADAEPLRDRRYDAYFWDTVAGKDRHFPFVHRFAIRGSVRRADAWHYLGTFYPPDTRLETDRIEVGLGRSLPYLGLGWSRARQGDGEDRRWALGDLATVQASLSPAQQTIQIRLRVPDFIADQRISLAVDDVVIKEIVPSDDSFNDYTATLESGPRPDISRIELRFDRFATYGDDPRPLAAQVAWIAFEIDG